MYDFIIDGFTWSFSRLNYSCPHEFLLNYIECLPGRDSMYGQVGTVAHKALELWAKGELSAFELAGWYEEHFDEYVTEDAPPSKTKDLKEDIYYKVLEYFEDFDPLWLDEYEILGVEKRVDFEIGGLKMVGYIDLLLKEKKTDRIIILDHKSGSLKILKSGKISKTDEQHFLEFKRQLYLYSKAVIEEYGKVDELRWNLFKDRRIISIPWREEEYKEALIWATETAEGLRNREDWEPKEDAGINNFYCKNLCGQRDNCKYCQPEREDEEYV